MKAPRCALGSGMQFCVAGALRMRGLWSEMRLNWWVGGSCRASCYPPDILLSSLYACPHSVHAKGFGLYPCMSLCFPIPSFPFMGLSFPICKLRELASRSLRSHQTVTLRPSSLCKAGSLVHTVWYTVYAQ